MRRYAKLKSETAKGGDSLGGTGVGRIIKLDLEVGQGDVYCIQLAQDRAQWRTTVNTVMNLRVP
jgi:hypothetical protein